MNAHLNRHAQTLKLALLSTRDLLVSLGPVLLLGVGLLVAAYWWLEPQPPKHVRLATGPAGSAYANFGKRYQAELARNGIEVELLPTEGALDNLSKLRDGSADIGFVRGGMADPESDEEAGIRSLGSLFYEPIWVIYRRDAARRVLRRRGLRSDEFTRLSELKGLRVNVDLPGSGVPQIVEKLLAVNHLKPTDLKLSNLPSTTAAEALGKGTLDAVVITSAPQSRLVRALLRAPAYGLMGFEQSEAYARRLPFLSAVTLPRGIIDLSKDLPTGDVRLLATTTSLLSRQDTHPALRQLFAQAAQRIHSNAGWFNGARDFPNTHTSELPVSAEGDRAINGSPPIWEHYLPFWASNLIERMWLVFGGVLVLMVPLSRVVPPLYTFRVRSRVFRWYAKLREIEARLDARQDEQQALLAELDHLERVTQRIAVPLSYAEELYTLRNNIHTIRARVQSRGSAPAIATD